MRRFRRPRLTFANVIACLALFIALGGTGYAAFKLPRHSVGNSQLKRNAVTSSKVKKGGIGLSEAWTQVAKTHWAADARHKNRVSTLRPLNVNSFQNFVPTGNCKSPGRIVLRASTSSSNFVTRVRFSVWMMSPG